jgi:hypothetical protein
MNWRKLGAILAGLGVVLSVAAGVGLILLVIALYPLQVGSAVAYGVVYTLLFGGTVAAGFFLYQLGRLVYRKVYRK